MTEGWSGGLLEFEFGGVAEGVEDAEEEIGGDVFGVAVHDGGDPGARGTSEASDFELGAGGRVEPVAPGIAEQVEGKHGDHDGEGGGGERSGRGKPRPYMKREDRRGIPRSARNDGRSAGGAVEGARRQKRRSKDVRGSGE